MPKYEIERKYLVKEVPDNFGQYKKYEILQGYFLDKKKRYYRVRKSNKAYSRTWKSEGTLIREEKEKGIGKREFENYWKKVGNTFLRKFRYKIPYQKYIIDLDIYLEGLSGLRTAEVEFDSVEESEKFIPPDWFGKEVTEDSEYKNSSLAQFGLPKSFQIGNQ